MKNFNTRTFVAPILGIALASLGGAQQVGASTVSYTDTWDVTDSATVSGQSSTADTTTTGHDTTLSLSYFNLSGYKLDRVQVVYVYNPMTLSASLSAASSTTVSTASSGLSTTVSSSALAAALSNTTNGEADVFTDGKTVSGTGKTVSDVIVSPVSPTDLSATRSLTTRTVLDSTDATVLADFSQAGAFSLSAGSTISLSYTATNIVSLATSGDDTGTVKVIYTYEQIQDVPEPSTWAMLLGGVGVLGFFQRMRRRA